MVTDRSRTMLRLFRHYRNGVLINAGGLLDQPAAYVDAMDQIDSCMPAQ